jgi:hypothetical protein
MARVRAVPSLSPRMRTVLAHAEEDAALALLGELAALT